MLLPDIKYSREGTNVTLYYTIKVWIYQHLLVIIVRFFFAQLDVLDIRIIKIAELIGKAIDQRKCGKCGYDLRLRFIDLYIVVICGIFLIFHTLHSFR